MIQNNGSTFSSRSSYTIDVKSLLPDVYQNLTIDNFYLSHSIAMSYYGTQPTQQSLFKSYDAETGVLSMGSFTSRITLSSNYYYLHVTYTITVVYYE